MLWRYHPRYVNEETGEQETKDSYFTFLNYFIDITPRPTQKQVAKQSGYSKRTVEDWFKKYKYIERYMNYHTELKQETTNNKVDQLKRMNDLLINRTKDAINTGTGLSNKHTNNMRNNSETDELNLEQLDILDPKYYIIKRDQKEIELSIQRQQEIIKNAIEIDEKLITEQDTRTILEEALERNNQPRFKENKDTINELYEEYEDEEY